MYALYAFYTAVDLGLLSLSTPPKTTTAWVKQQFGHFKRELSPYLNPGLWNSVPEQGQNIMVWFHIQFI